jgi:hypothetical protein
MEEEESKESSAKKDLQSSPPPKHQLGEESKTEIIDSVEKLK